MFKWTVENRHPPQGTSRGQAHLPETGALGGDPVKRDHTDARGRSYLFEAEPVPVIEHEQHQRLEEGHLELLLPLEESRHHMGLSTSGEF